jgi:signal transduction histidine kinase
MRAASSLSNRIFLACTLLAISSLGLAFWFVNARVTREAESDLRRSLEEASAVVEQHRATTLTDTFLRLARLVADLPKLKAAVETKDPPTVQPLVQDYRLQTSVDLLVVSAPDGTVLGSAGADGVTLPAPARAEPPHETALFVPHSRGLLHLLGVPILLGVDNAELLGWLTVGMFLDHDRAVQFRRVTGGSEIAFGAANRILASSLPPESHDALRQVMGTREITSLWIGDTEYLALAEPLRARIGAPPGAGGPEPVVIVLRSRTERLEILGTLRAGLAGGLLVAVLLATIVSYVVARTITRPLAAVTGAMGDVAATGDLTRRVPVRSRAWDDEDARLLATAFNTLTESIARFRHEESQKERLSALGRLSTVIAHEIRNPLMIIRASLRALGRDQVTAAELREAVADIDEETERLNRIVTEVLDFARPLRFDLGETDVNDVCRASASAVFLGDARDDLLLELDPQVPPIVTDGERLRTALVNILTNARHAVDAAASGIPPRSAAVHASRGERGAARVTAAARGTGVAPWPSVRLRTRHQAGRIVITIEDHGIGIAPEDMAHIFDPYFTTRRAGTGLGLPIARNIIDGLGGAIRIASRPGEGTEIQLDLPVWHGAGGEAGPDPEAAAGRGAAGAEHQPGLRSGASS